MMETPAFTKLRRGAAPANGVIVPRAEDQDGMVRMSFVDFQKGLMVALILTGHYLQFYVYSGSELYWDDPLFKVLYIFVFAYYFAVSGYAIASNLAKVSLLTVIKYKFAQYILPFCFWYALGLLSVIGLHAYQTGELARPSLSVMSGLFNAFWILFSDVVCTVLIRIALMLPLPAKLTIPLSLLVVFLIPNGDRITLISMVRYAYIGFAIGYMLAIYRIDVTPRWWMVLVMIPICGAIYQVWTIDTFIYNNRLNYLSAATRGQVALMIVGTAAFSFVAYPILKWLHAQLGHSPGLNNYLYMLASLNSLIILFEVDFYYLVSHGEVAKTNIYPVDLAIACVGSFAVIALIPKTFGLIPPGTPLFRLIWGTTATLGDHSSSESKQRIASGLERKAF
jgi:hypothetical protein